MCLVWNDDGSMCSEEELKVRLELYHKGLYMPELKKLREEMYRKRREYWDARLPEIREKYKNYNWKQHETKH
jgi:hypothetical protein